MKHEKTLLKTSLYHLSLYRKYKILFYMTHIIKIIYYIETSVIMMFKYKYII